jgi:hypothetical protein
MRRVRNRWGEPVFKFVACLLQHARDRYFIAGDDDSWLDIPYWVCAYANNQHKYAPFASLIEIRFLKFRLISRIYRTKMVRGRIIVRPVIARASDQACVVMSSARAGWAAT